MSRMTREQLTSLATPRATPVASAYVPLERSFPESRQNAVRLRDALDAAADRLGKAGVAPSEVERMVAEARRTATFGENGEANRSLALALLLEPNGVHTFELPFSCLETIDVGTRFHLAPLVRLLHWPAEFHLLTLSGEAARLYDGTSMSMREVELPRASPRSFAEFMQSVEPDPAVRFQSGPGREGGSSGAVIHGGTSAKDAARDRRHEYVQTVAKALGNGTVLRGKPLVLAAVGELHPVFRDAYPGDNLIEPGVHGSPDGMDFAEIRNRASALVAPARCGETKRALDQFRSIAHSGKASVDPSTIVKAAGEGRVETLIIASDERLWGRWDAAAQTATPTNNPTRQPGDVDLIDQALAEALQHGGHVCSIPRAEIPDRATMAAVLRWTA